MSIKSILTCASALVFGLCGCDSGSSGGAAANGLATGPRAIDGALVSAGFEKAALDKVLGDKKTQTYAAFKEQIGDDFTEIMDKAGLADAEVAWAAFSLLDVEFDAEGEPKGVPEMAFALAFGHDFDKLLAAAKEKSSEREKKMMKETTILGEKACVLSDDDITLAWVSIGGKILVGASSEDTAAKAVALYRDGKGGKAIDMGGDTFLRIAANAIGQRVCAKMPAERLGGALPPSIPNGADILRGLKDASLAVAATGNGGVAASVKFETASEADATALANAANENIAPMKALFAMTAQQDPSSKPLVDALNALTVKTDGATLAADITLCGDTYKAIIEKSME